MLIYIRTQDMDEILAPVTAENIPQYLMDIFEGEAAKDEQRRKDKMEAHLYINLKPVFEEDYLRQSAEPSDLIDFTKEAKDCPSFRVKKASTLAEFKVHFHSAMRNVMQITHAVNVRERECV
jgi:ubiquitin carboxyl-terminal hydrolase 7